MRGFKMLVVSLTGACNLSCRYCYAKNQNPSYMDFSVAQKVLDILMESDERAVLQISGGEPLLAFPLLKKIISYIEAQNAQISVQLQTNGTLLTEEIADYLYQKKIALGISLDGKWNINDVYRVYKNGQGSSIDTINAIKLLAEKKIALGITTVITRENVDHLAELVEFAYFLGNIRRIGFDILRRQGGGEDLLMPLPDKIYSGVQKAFQRGAELSKLLPYKIQFSQLEQAKAILTSIKRRDVEQKEKFSTAFHHCHAMNGDGAHVDAEGNFYTCSSFVGDERFFIGNARTGIDEEKRLAIAEFIQKNMHECLRCKEINACGGACFARREGAAGTEAECALKRASINFLTGDFTI